MFDFRYHALSLVAVFLALGLGLVLGVTIGDSLVSDTQRNLSSSLRGDLVEARAAARESRDQAARRDEALDAVAPLVAAGRLRGVRVAVVGWGGLPEDVRGSVERALDDAGAEVDSVSVLDASSGADELSEAFGERFQRLSDDDDGRRALMTRLGRSLAAGGPVAKRLERELPESFEGPYEGADAVVLHAEVPPEDPDEAARARGELLEPLLAGLREAASPVVGVEAADVDSPSAVGFFEDAGVASVDNADTSAGRVALVLSLAGARGSFGFKDGADSVLPEDIEARPGR